MIYVFNIGTTAKCLILPQAVERRRTKGFWPNFGYNIVSSLPHTFPHKSKDHYHPVPLCG